MKKIIIITLIALLIIAIIIFIFLRKKKIVSYNEILKYDAKLGNVIEVSYSDSGNSLGNIDETTISFEKQTVTTRYRTENGEKTLVKEYSIDDSDLEELQKYIKSKNFAAYKDKLKDVPEDEILDGSIPRIHFIFESDNNYSRKSIFSISFFSKIPNECIKDMSELKKKMFSFIKEDNLVKSSYEEE